MSYLLASHRPAFALTTIAISNGRLDFATNPAGTKCLGEPRPAHALPLQSAARQFLAAAQESPKAPANELDVLQSPTSKFDLSSQSLGVPQQGCFYKTAEIVLKTTERGLYSAHLLLPTYCF
jgi:hypothetical protein